MVILNRWKIFQGSSSFMGGSSATSWVWESSDAASDNTEDESVDRTATLWEYIKGQDEWVSDSHLTCSQLLSDHYHSLKFTMASRNNCSRNCSSGSLRNSCHMPASSSMALCSTNMGCGEVFCIPSSCPDHTWFMDNCPETFADPINGQPGTGEASGFENSCGSSAYCVSRPCHGSHHLPASSFVSGTCLPASYRPVSFVTSSCRPVSPFVNNCGPVSCVSGGYRPLPCISNSCRPQGVVTYGCRPSGCVTYGPQTIHIVSNSLRPLQPVCGGGGCQPAMPVFGTCRPSCH